MTENNQQTTEPSAPAHVRTSRVRLLAVGAAVLIVLVIAAIVMDSWRKFQIREMQSEPHIHFGGIYTGQYSVHSETGNYGRTFAQIQWRPEGKWRYTYYMCNDVIPPNPGEAHPLPPGLKPACDDQNYIIIAVANLDFDKNIDVWTIDQDKNEHHLYNDLNNSGP